MLPDLDRIVTDLAGSGRSVYPGFLSPDEVRALREETNELLREGSFQRAGVGSGADFKVRPEIRSDLILWLEEPFTPAQLPYLYLLEDLRLAINRTLYLGLFGFEGHLAIYPPGAFYQKHLDRFLGAGDDGSRIVSTVLYLNEDWKPEDGGQIRLYDSPEDGSAWQDVLPAGGTLVTFLSDSVCHEVLPASRERMSLTGWFTRRT